MDELLHYACASGVPFPSTEGPDPALDPPAVLLGLQQGNGPVVATRCPVRQREPLASTLPLGKHFRPHRWSAFRRCSEEPWCTSEQGFYSLSVRDLERRLTGNLSYH